MQLLPAAEVRPSQKPHVLLRHRPCWACNMLKGGRQADLLCSGLVSSILGCQLLVIRVQSGLSGARNSLRLQRSHLHLIQRLMCLLHKGGGSNTD